MGFQELDVDLGSRVTCKFIEVRFCQVTRSQSTMQQRVELSWGDSYTYSYSYHYYYYYSYYSQLFKKTF